MEIQFEELVEGKTYYLATAGLPIVMFVFGEACGNELFPSTHRIDVTAKNSNGETKTYRTILSKMTISNSKIYKLFTSREAAEAWKPTDEAIKASVAIHRGLPGYVTL